MKEICEACGEDCYGVLDPMAYDHEEAGVVSHCCGAGVLTGNGYMTRDEYDKETKKERGEWFINDYGYDYNYR